MSLRTASWRDWAAMVRLPNIPTVWSNVFTAWVLAGGALASGKDWSRLGAMVAAGTLLYVAGTLLNDVADAEFDSRHRPERAIPAERVRRGVVFIASFASLVVGTIIFFVTGGYFAPLLVTLILGYTKVHKQSPLAGAVLMGLCRAALALTIVAAVDVAYGSAGWLRTGLWMGVLGAYVCGISVVAQKEANPRRRQTVIWMLGALPLLDAVFLVCLGEAGFALVPGVCLVLSWALRRVASPT